MAIMRTMGAEGNAGRAALAVLFGGHAVPDGCERDAVIKNQTFFSKARRRRF